MARPENQIPELADDADDDEALRYAIALSLQDETAAATIVIDDSDSDHGDDDGSLPAASSSNSTQQQTQSQAQSQSLSQQSQFGSLFIDRKAMEQERLNRLAKRQRPLTDENNEDEDDDLVEIPPPKKQAISKTPTESNTNNVRAATISTLTTSSNNSSDLLYPNPTVKRTWSRGSPRTGDEITIEEIFQKDKLELAVLSSFQWDEEWMLSKLDYRRTKILLVAFAKDEAQKNVMRANVPANIKFCFPPMHGVGAMHSKLQLLKYPGHLRVVIPTGNLMSYDWGETGVMENAAGVGEKMVASLANYDFSKTSDIAFVHTIPGSHSAKAVERTDPSWEQASEATS
ncbi:hypothetical protein ACHAQJ_001248 [Trichoderma viride]